MVVATTMSYWQHGKCQQLSIAFAPHEMYANANCGDYFCFSLSFFFFFCVFAVFVHKRPLLFIFIAFRFLQKNIIKNNGNNNATMGLMAFLSQVSKVIGQLDGWWVRGSWRATAASVNNLKAIWVMLVGTFNSWIVLMLAAITSDSQRRSSGQPFSRQRDVMTFAFQSEGLVRGAQANAYNGWKEFVTYVGI